MKKVLLIIGLAALSFGLSAAGSIMLAKQQQEAKDAESEGTDGDVSIAQSEGLEQTETADANSPEAMDLPLPVKARPVSPEEIYRYGVIFQKREEGIRQREEALEKERLRMKLVFEDVRTEQRELEGMEEQIRGKIAEAGQLLQKIGQKQQDLTREQEQAKKELDQFKENQTEYQTAELENIKQLSKWFQAMQPDKAAEYLKELSNDGRMDTAVQILGNFEEREASKILSALDDAALVVQLAEKFKGLKRPEKKKSTR